MFLEDAGFDWKVLGPDVSHVDYVAWQCDQDAYACSGQKCSAQSILFLHGNWKAAGLLDKMKVHSPRPLLWKLARCATAAPGTTKDAFRVMQARAASRKLSDLTIGPVLTWTTEAMLGHTNKLLQIPGG